MCTPIAAVMVVSAVVAAQQQNQAAKAAEEQAKAAGGVERSNLQDIQQEQAVAGQGNMLQNALEAMRRSSTATVGGAEAGVSPVTSINQEMMAESLQKGNIQYNVERGQAQTGRQITASHLRQDTAAAQARDLSGGNYGLTNNNVCTFGADDLKFWVEFDGSVEVRQGLGKLA